MGDLRPQYPSVSASWTKRGRGVGEFYPRVENEQIGMGDENENRGIINYAVIVM